jgi:hypothetical protein
MGCSITHLNSLLQGFQDWFGGVGPLSRKKGFVLEVLARTPGEF